MSKTYRCKFNFKEQIEHKTSSSAELRLNIPPIGTSMERAKAIEKAAADSGWELINEKASKKYKENIQIELDPQTQVVKISIEDKRNISVEVDKTIDVYDSLYREDVANKKAKEIFDEILKDEADKIHQGMIEKELDGIIDQLTEELRMVSGCAYKNLLITQSQKLFGNIVPVEEVLPNGNHRLVIEVETDQIAL